MKTRDIRIRCDIGPRLEGVSHRVSEGEILVGEPQADAPPPGAGGRVPMVAEEESERRKKCVVRQHDPRDARGCRVLLRRRSDPRRRRRDRAGAGGPEAAGVRFSGGSVGKRSGLAGAGSIQRAYRSAAAEGPCIATRARPAGQTLPHSGVGRWQADRKSTRLNSSHSQISYAVFCLKKKKKSKMRVVRQQEKKINKLQCD